MSRFIPIVEAVKLSLLGNNDILQRDKGRMLTWAPHVFHDLELTTIKAPTRQVIQINKRTNSIDLPCPFDQLSSVNVIDDCGVIYPVYKNNTINRGLVEISAPKDCACEYKCGYQLCNTVKGYEAVTTVKSDKLPNGEDISFTCIDRKAIDSNGFFYEEIQYPQRIYEDGVWVNTVLHTQTRELCKVEIDNNGCICDTDGNIDALCNCCGINTCNPGDICYGGTSMTPPNENCDTWIYYCNSKADWFSMQCGCFPNWRKECNNIYNLSELGNRLEFPANFGFDKVLIRFYQDVNLQNLQIPFIAIDTFIMGLKWWNVRFDDKKQPLAVKYESDYSKLKWGLIGELNKYRIAELKMILAPTTFVPGYIITREGTDYNTGYYI